MTCTHCMAVKQGPQQGIGIIALCISLQYFLQHTRYLCDRVYVVQEECLELAEAMAMNELNVWAITNNSGMLAYYC